MLYQLLAGHPPFSAVRVPRLLSMHLTEEPPRLDGPAPLLPPDLIEFVHRLLLKDPALRPTMREVVAELERMQAQRGSASAQSLAPPASARRPEVPDAHDEPEEREDRRLAAPRPGRPAGDRWERPYSDGRTEGAGDLGQGINAYDHTLSSGPFALPPPRLSLHEAGTQGVSSGPHHAPSRVSQEAGTQVNSGPHYVPPRSAPEPAPTLVRSSLSSPQSPSSTSSTIASNAAQSSGLHTAPGTGERTPVPPRPHGRWSLFLASVLGGLTVAAVGWVLRPAPHGSVPAEPRPPALNVAAPPADAPLRTLPPAAAPIPVPSAPSQPPPASALTGPAAPPASVESVPEKAPDISKRSGPSAKGTRDPILKRPKGPARPAVPPKKPGSVAAPGVPHPDPPPPNRPPDAPAKPQFKIID